MNRIDPLDVVVFSLDESGLTPGAVAQVDRAAQWLLRHRGHRIVLEGHTDLLGFSAHNADLAARRMQAVKQRLIAWGLPSDRVVLVTYGEALATIPNNPEERRVVMFVTDRPLRQVVTQQLEFRHALVANWTERGRQLTARFGDDS